MNIESYTTELVGETEFKFFSEGKNGRFEMRIRFDYLDDDLYNLAFGVWDEDAQKLDDCIEVRNGDMNKILGTVASKALDFLENNPESSVFATGRTLPGKLAIRNRKYQMGINMYYAELIDRYHIYGFKAAINITGNNLRSLTEWVGDWEPFRKNINYDAFLINFK